MTPFVEMSVESIAIDPNSNMPFVLLKDKSAAKSLPIWIGLFEASAIATKLEKINVARPMTHDLLNNMMDCLGGELMRIEVHDLRDNTFFAELLVRRETGEEVRIDSRPSDAIALALRSDSPIFVAETVLKKLKKQEVPKTLSPVTEEKDKKTWSEFLESLDPEAFGKYKQ